MPSRPIMLLTLALWPTLAWGRGDHLLLSKVLLEPAEGAYLEIVNPLDTAEPLERTLVAATSTPYRADMAWPYYGMPLMGDSMEEVVVRFPSASEVGPGERVVVALSGAKAFRSVHGEGAVLHFEVVPPNTPDEEDVANMELPDGVAIDVEALSPRQGRMVLFSWDGESDLVQDLDVLLWGDGSCALDKGLVAQDGPDEDVVPSEYALETAVSQQRPAAQPGFGMTLVRLDLGEALEAAGGNGLTGDDETSEDLEISWTASMATPPGLEPQTAGAISGTVRGAQGVGVAGCLVELGDLSAVTDEEGYYILPDVAEGIWEITVSCPGHEGAAVTLEHPPATVANVMVQPLEHRLVGVVRSVEGERPLINATVTVWVEGGEEWLQAVTNAEGEWFIEGVPTGTHRMVAAADGLMPSEIDHLVVAGDSRVDFMLTPPRPPELETVGHEFSMSCGMFPTGEAGGILVALLGLVLLGLRRRRPEA